MTHRRLAFTRPRRGRQRAQGSAYIVALLALVLLTLVGLAVVFITQSELQIGGNERMISRVFYSADSGVSIATARALVNGDYLVGGKLVKFPDTASGSIVATTNQVQLSPFYLLQEQPCNLCSINNKGQYSTKAYSAATYTETSTALRVGGNADTPLAGRSVTAFVGVQPWQVSIDAEKGSEDATRAIGSRGKQ